MANEVRRRQLRKPNWKAVAMVLRGNAGYLEQDCRKE